MGTRDRPEFFRGEAEAPASRVGADLRVTRERLGWSLAAVSDHLRIRLPYLEGIEEGRTEDLPGPAYAIGFVRAYAKVLGLDQDEVARRFRAEAGDVKHTELTFPAPVPDRGIPALAVVAVGAILVIGAYAAWYRVSGSERPGPETVQTIPEHLAPLADRAPTPAPPSPASAPPPEPPVAVAPDVPSVSPSSAAAMTPPPPSAAGAEGGRIVVRARGDAWIQVKDARGQLLLNRTMRVGESWPVPTRPAAAGGGLAGGTQTALLLTTGNAGQTEVLVDGVSTGPLGIDGAVRRDLPLDAAAIKDGKLAVSAAPPFRVSPRNQ